ncbi:hypothetical protein XENORESO_000652 [Xenotaenia resolanae]|uniref:Uncharacterized protein n=1 Tax=Xenotaenia resolanae TaxID=208358 RepID=A0ABV0W939_9TELE
MNPPQDLELPKHKWYHGYPPQGLFTSAATWLLAFCCPATSNSIMAFCPKALWCPSVSINSSIMALLCPNSSNTMIGTHLRARGLPNISKNMVTTCPRDFKRNSNLIYCLRPQMYCSSMVIQSKYSNNNIMASFPKIPNSSSTIMAFYPRIQMY